MPVTRRYYANNAPQLTLQSSITNSAVSATSASAPTGWPSQFPFFATLELNTANEEIISVTAIAGSVFTIVRAQGGTSGIAHSAGATLDLTFVAQDFDEANAHHVATTGVHGVTGSLVGTSDSQTLTNKTLANPAVTGTLAGANATLSGTLGVTGTTTLGVVNTGAATASSVTSTGALSGASLTVSGNATVGGTLGVTGDLTASGAGTGLAVTNNATVGGTLAVSGDVTASGAGTGLAVTNNATVGGTLGVTGAATVGSLTVGGASIPVGAWTAYTPGFANWTVGAGAITARWIQIGKIVIIRWNIVAGAGAAYNASQVQISLPVQAHGTGDQDCPITVSNGAANYPGLANIPASATAANIFVVTGNADTHMVAMSNSSTVNPGSSGNVSGVLVYEAA